MSWPKNIIHLNSALMVKDLLFKYGGEKRWKVQTFTFTPYIGGQGVWMG